MSAPSTSGLSVEFLLQVIGVKYGSFTLLNKMMKQFTCNTVGMEKLLTFHIHKKFVEDLTKQKVNVWLFFRQMATECVNEQITNSNHFCQHLLEKEEIERPSLQVEEYPKQITQLCA